MYRAFALKALRAEIPLDDPAASGALCRRNQIRLEPGEEENRVLLDGEDVTGQIRNQTVTDAASQGKRLPAIRAWMVKRQQEMGAEGGVVMEGRDIGTVVFPNAEVKIFLDAAPEVRGMRRSIRLASAAIRSQARATARRSDPRPARPRRAGPQPSRLAAEACARRVLLDSTNMTLEEAVKAAESTVNDWLAKSESRRIE